MSYSAGDGRPPIPAEIRRRVLVEAGHRCAIPTCRYIEIDVHHIIPWPKCQAHDYDNLIALCPNCHRRADRGQIDREALRLYKFNLRFTHDKFSQLEVDVLFELSSLSAAMQWPPFMLILLKRLLDASYIAVHRQEGGGVFIGGMRSNPDLITITPKGRSFIAELGLHEL
ncbi:MAG: HNH endonuclease signature motif containing protein [Methylocella sp.]